MIGGLVGTGLMLGAGAIAVLNAPPAGPGQEATWPAGETISLDRIPGERNSGDPTVTCTVTPEGQPAGHKRWLTVGVSVAPDFIGTATITCDQPVALMTGTARIVASYARGPLIAVPLFVIAVGILCFVPRFTYYWASLSTTGWLRRMLRIPPPD